MRHEIFNILAVVVMFTLLLAAGSCSKDNINGALDGQWQIKEISDGNSTFELTEKRYISFQLHVCQLRVWGKVFANGNLKYNGKTIKIDFPYVEGEENERLKEWGIFANPAEFEVVSLDSDRLVIRRRDITVRLVKF